MKAIQEGRLKKPEDWKGPLCGADKFCDRLSLLDTWKEKQNGCRVCFAERKLPLPDHELHPATPAYLDVITLAAVMPGLVEYAFDRDAIREEELRILAAGMMFSNRLKGGGSGAV